MKNIGTNNVEKTITYSLPLYMIWKIKYFLIVHTGEDASKGNKELKAEFKEDAHYVAIAF